ncbi:DNA repair protein RAD51-like protein 4 [Psilocybe cubensis]|uniref:Rad51-like C-terminal domain-containing protein n=2 Tax=Psilocybe cubensis TaxID=181762 RepID=A0A8H7Y368_PSICU|nr:DNA repair protein RAD51-like protein 4 [Psilocybe cubensis]KAH9481595.1 DNA repair protein RAD51-like protein 4 [Psilocybe cubensis]
MRLASLVPFIPADLVASLEAHGIRTEFDLLFSASTFDIYKRLPANTVTFQELIDYTSLVAEHCAAPGISGQEIFRLEKLASSEYSELQSGCASLDALLHGLGGRKVLEISGDKGTGKSVRSQETLALSLLLHHVKCSPANKAVWIDTTGEFSLEKATQLINAFQMPPTTLERVEVSLAFDIDGARALFEEINLRAEIKFLVIDTITPLLGPLLSAASAQGHAIMTEFMQQLQSFSQSFGASVLVGAHK